MEDKELQRLREETAALHKRSEELVAEAQKLIAESLRLRESMRKFEQEAADRVKR